MTPNFDGPIKGFDSWLGPQGDLADLHRLISGTGSAQGPAEAHRMIRRRWQDGAALRTDLERIRALGFRSVIGMTDPRLFEALGRGPSDQMPRPLPIVPNIQGLMREAVEFGMIGAGMRRAWRVGPAALTGIGLRSLPRLNSIRRRDFPTLLRTFIELELADFARYDPPLIFLQAQMTDLALAMHNPRIIEAFMEAIRRRTSAAPGLVTHNFAAAMSSLKTWGIHVAAVLTPWDSAGTRLRPNAHDWEQAARAAGIPIWADRQLGMAPPTEADRAALGRAGLTGFCRDDLTLWSEA